MADDPSFDSFDPPLTDEEWEPFAAAVGIEPPPSIPDRFGMVWPDGAMLDVTESARLFDQDPEQRARLMAAKAGGRPVRFRTVVEWLPDV